MYNENLIQANKEYRTLAEEKILEAIPHEIVEVTMAEQRIRPSGRVVYIVAAIIGDHVFVGKGEKAFEAIDNVVNDAKFIGTPFRDDANVTDLYIGA